MVSLNSLSKTHYLWLEKMGWNNSSNLEAAGMILSEIGEAASECEPFSEDNLKKELSDIILRSIGLGMRFNFNIDQSIKDASKDWDVWQKSKKWNDKNNLECLSLMTGQGVPIVNLCRNDNPGVDLSKYLALLILSALFLGSRNGMDMINCVSEKN